MKDAEEEDDEEEPQKSATQQVPRTADSIKWAKEMQRACSKLAILSSDHSLKATDLNL